MLQIVEQVCRELGAGRKRDFIFARYERDAYGEWVVKLPKSAPCGRSGECRIREHSMRERRTGPGHALLVIECTVHGRYFTLYPAGYVPYGRKRLVVEDEANEQTIFTAAKEAAAGGERWSEIGNEGRWWSTQWRQIRRCGELLGLECEGLEGERVAMNLGISLHEHVESRSRYAHSSFRERGRAVMQVLTAAIAAGVGLLWRLLKAGYPAGCLGRSFYADAQQRLIAVTLF
jgi:hypothetical protein